MLDRMKKYLGQQVVIVYMDTKGKFTKRTISLRSVSQTHIRAVCNECNAPRQFRLDGIMAMEPIRGRAV